MKKLLALLMSLILTVTFAACGTQPAQTDISAPASKPSVAEPTPTQDDPELVRAAALGLITDETQKTSEKAVTHAEFCSMLSMVIDKLYGEKYLAKWQSVAELALASDTPMLRSDGAMAIFEAALAVGMDDLFSMV